MRRISIAFGALLGIFASWVLLGDRILEEAEPNRPVPTTIRESPAGAAGVPTDRATIPEVKSPELQSSVVESGETCTEEAARLGIAFAQQEALDEEACARFVRMMAGPRVLVLPGFAGFEIPDLGEGHPRARLFDESDNPAWSRTMEGRIFSESAKVVDFPLITLHAVCRSSTCGVLFVYSNDASHVGSYNYYAQELADGLGFRGFHAGISRNSAGIGFMYAYLGDWHTPRPQ